MPCSNSRQCNKNFIFVATTEESTRPSYRKDMSNKCDEIYESPLSSPINHETIIFPFKCGFQRLCEILFKIFVAGIVS